MADLTFEQLKQNYALLESDLQDESKKTIQEGIDIDKDLTLSEAFDKLLENGTSANLWNESIKTAVAHLCSKVLSSATKIPGTDITIADIKNANAGNSFEENGEWVKPYTNVDGDNYSDVRGNDKIKSVLTNNKNLQYTNETINKYIRLLMPQYTRRVEIEDLNRNFWVIGQTIAGISAYLFDDNSPINTMFKSLISEVNQLWENLLYLWSDQFVTDVHSEVVYLPHNSSITEMKFDDFGESLVLTPNIIISRLQYLVQQYPKCHLCIVPVSRASNYIFNYYNKEIYWGIYLYNANSQEWTVYRFANNYANNPSPTPSYGKFLSLYQSKPYGFSIDTSTDASKQHMTAVYVNELDKNYEIYYPFSDPPSSASTKNYYGGLRTIPKLSAIVEEKDDQLQFNVDFNITVVDIGMYLIKGFLSYHEKYSLQNAILITGVEEPEALSITAKVINKNSTPEEREKIIPIQSGYYLGEMPSVNQIIPEIDYSINMQTVTLLPVMQPLWTTMNVPAYKNVLKENSKNVLQKYSETHPSTKQITLYTGQYNCNVFDSNAAPELTNVYYLDSNNLKTTALGGKSHYKHSFYANQSGDQTPSQITNCVVDGNTLQKLEYYLGSKKIQDEELDSGNYWNRYRSQVSYGCAISIPSMESPLIVEDYNFWWTYIGSNNDQFSQAPLYRLEYKENGQTWGVEDKSSRGRRGQKWWFGTFYHKGEKLSTNNWAIKLTEVHMCFAPLTNSGYQPANGRDGGSRLTLKYYDNAGALQTIIAGGGYTSLSNLKTAYKTISRTSDGKIANNAARFSYAPYYMKGNIGMSPTGAYGGNIYYFLPMVTMVKTHIFKYNGSTVDYANQVWRRVNSIEEWLNDGTWKDLKQNGEFSNKATYIELDNNLMQNYTAYKRSSSFSDNDAIKHSIALMLPYSFSGAFVGDFENDGWLDFEHFPLRGFGPADDNGNKVSWDQATRYIRERPINWDWNRTMYN